MSFWKKGNFVSSSIKIYDYLVNDINCKYAWRCDKKNIFNLYQNNLKSNHLEIGPGSGYFLYPENHNKKIDNLILMDINKPILDHSYNNLKSNYSNISCFNHNIFEKEIELNNINSVGINYVLHCVPGSLEEKFDKLVNNIKSKNELIIFGSTVVNDYNKQTYLSDLELKLLNYYGIFNNNNDYSYNFINYLDSKKYIYRTLIYGNVLTFKIII